MHVLTCWRRPLPHNPLLRTVCLAGLLAGLAGCVEESVVARTDAAYGGAVYDARCAQCHGATGTDAGPTSTGPGKQPPDLRGLSARNDGVFPRDYVMQMIVGFERARDPDAAMPEFGRQGLGHVIQVEYDDGHSAPMPADLIALANYLESIQR